MEETYKLLRDFTSPVVAITSLRGDETNGMIANSAMRASLSDKKPRISVYIHKFNYSHDMIFESGAFVLHLLHTGQLQTVYSLGFASRRDGPKLDAIPHRVGRLGIPVLEDSYSYFECRVVNVMDTGPSTLFLGAVEHAVRGPGEMPMSSIFLRGAMPRDRAAEYAAGIEEAQKFATEMTDTMKPVVWRGFDA